MIVLWSRSLFECIKSKNILQILKRNGSMIILLLLFDTYSGKYVRINEFDHFIFSQRWLPTACIEYIEKNTSLGNQHFCILPKNYKTWAIHGLWPTLENTLGPFFCNKSMPFDIYKIKPIESDLELYWPNIEGGKSVGSLWKHEWEKHGTCAAQLESLNTEIKYFNTTLTFYNMHNMQELFISNAIVPSEKGLYISDLLYKLNSIIGKIPQIHCIYEVKTKQPYLSEIRLCYNKKLELIDCLIKQNSELKNNGNLMNGLTNCPDDRPVKFSNNINPVLKSKRVSKKYEKLYDILSIIGFLQRVSI